MAITVPTADDVQALHAFIYERADEEHAAAMDDPTMDGAAMERFSRVSNSNKYAITATAELLVGLLSRGDDEQVARAWHCLTGAGEQWRDHPDYLARWENAQLAQIRQQLGG
ncbi:hypothetical protein [Streptomyces sp. ME19-01-6]|uniref:hypothetical protein n=1 Tax=Streptomyces sp. ME19-01-6 TaxID=3028686 RepID=UPI0029A7A108|nr:hypothetical protein [Streptomyces sp. ME19-01-6]MDX3232906.1 hypothetical protein [Streptomyces sp. ME19-01-6]